MSFRKGLLSYFSHPPRESKTVAEDVPALRASAESWKQHAGQKARRVLNTHVLRDIFDLRLRTLAARAAIPPREQREALFREVSPAYVAAIEQSAAEWGDHIHATRLHELTWHTPVVRPKPGGPSKAWIAKQRFPYRALTQTRELAVGGIMLDIGANTGRMSISRAVLGDVVAAYCAEPDPLNYACLVRNVVENRLNGLLMPDQLAIADRDGTARLRRADVSGGHRVLADDTATHDGAGTPSDPPKDAERLIEVRCRTLDSWLAGLRVDPDAVTFVKVDVQGYEMRVLQGASALLARRHVAWQLELDPAHLAAAGTSLADLYAKLQQHFTHFIDMNGALTGPRQRTIETLSEGLAYLAGSREKTDILVYCASH